MKKITINKELAYCGGECPYYVQMNKSITCHLGWVREIDTPDAFPEWCPLPQIDKSI